MELLDNHVRNPSFGNVVRQKFADANSPTRAASSVKLSRKNSVAKNTGPYSDASIYSIPSRAIPRNARKQIIVNDASEIYTDFMPEGFSNFPKPPEVSPSTSFTGKDKMTKPEVGQVKKPKRNKPTPNQSNATEENIQPKIVQEEKIEPVVEPPTQTPTNQKTSAVRKAPEVPKQPPQPQQCDVVIPKIPPPTQPPLKIQTELKPEVKPEIQRPPKVIEIPRPEIVKMGEPEVKTEVKLQRAPSTKIRTKIVSTFEEMCLGLSSSEENLQVEDHLRTEEQNRLQAKPELSSPSRENLISEETDIDCLEMPAKMEPIMPAGPFDSNVPEYISKPQIQNDPFEWQDQKETFEIDPFETSDVFDNAIVQKMAPSNESQMATITTEVAVEQYAEIKRYDSQNSMISDAKSLRRNSSDFRERALSMKTDRTFDITEVTKMDFKCNISLSTDKFS